MSTYSPIRPGGHSSLAAWMAWRRYLTTVRASDPRMYELVEESAWQRLREELASAGRLLPEDVPVLSFP